MINRINKTKTYKANRSDIFNYFTDPVLLANWYYADDLSLKIPFLEKRKGGKFRHEHKTSSGEESICSGEFIDFEFNKKLITEEEVYNNEGEKMIYGLVTEIAFSDDPGGCLVEITQSGFNNKDEVNKYKKFWSQSLDRLDSIF